MLLFITTTRDRDHLFKFKRRCVVKRRKFSLQFVSNKLVINTAKKKREMLQGERENVVRKQRNPSRWAVLTCFRFGREGGLPLVETV